MNNNKDFALLEFWMQNPPQLVILDLSPTLTRIKLRGRFAFLEGK